MATVDLDNVELVDTELPLIPVRMLNEFTYCPRLGYLEWVDGEWSDNLETMQGTFGHRNVDIPDKKNIQPPEKAVSEIEDETPVGLTETIHGRSITLASQHLGIIAKLDLLELDGNLATPVDYKRGKIPQNEHQAYDPERVQLCAQGLILREHGFQCDSGVLYYIASKKRVTIPFDDQLIEFTKGQIAHFRLVSISGKCPPPLEDSPKCPRCSLVGICLPDETRYLQEIIPLQQLLETQHSTDEPAISPITIRTKDGLRKLLPANNQALPLYVQHQGAIVGKSGERLTIKYKDEELNSVRLIDVSQLCLYGSVMISAQALKELTTRGIPVCHYSYGGWFHGITTGHHHNNINLRIKQFETAANPQAALKIARQLIAGKIKNSRTILRRHLGDKDHPVLSQLQSWHDKVLTTDSAASLLGLEGMAAKEYFAAFFPLIKYDCETSILYRNRRPPKDPVNAVLSFVYSLLTKELTIATQAVGFDPLLGFFHKPRFSRPSLALDLAEEFRPIIADSVTLTVFNNEEVSPSSFIQRAGAVTMTDTCRKCVISAFERRMQTEITHPLFGYKISYRRILEVQARLLARYLMGELQEYPNLTTR